MSSFDGIVLDADGHLDMDQFPDDGTDLDAEALSALRGALHDDPVEEPSAEEFTGIVDGITNGAADDGPFATGEAGLVAQAAEDTDDGTDVDAEASDGTDGSDDDADDDGAEGLVADAAEADDDGFDGLADAFDDFDADLGAVEDTALAVDDGDADVPAEIADIDDLL